MHSTIALASSAGVALGNAPFSAAPSLKIGRASSEHPGQIAGAGEPLLALKMPAVKVPWMQAALPEWVHPAPGSPAIASNAFGYEIRVVYSDGSIHQPNNYLRAAAAELHQRDKVGQIQEVHVMPSPRSLRSDGATRLHLRPPFPI